MFIVTIFWDDRAMHCAGWKTQQLAQDQIDFWVGHNPAYAAKGKPVFTWTMVFDSALAC